MKNEHRTENLDLNYLHVKPSKYFTGFLAPTTKLSGFGGSIPGFVAEF